MRIQIRIYSVLKNHPNTNTDSIRFENICRIRIRISLFGLNYSNTIRILNYSLTSECNTHELLLWISIPLVNVKTLPDTVWFSEKRWWCLSMVSYLHFKFLDSKDIKIGVFPIIAKATKSFVPDKGFVRGAAGLKTIF